MSVPCSPLRSGDDPVENGEGEEEGEEQEGAGPVKGTGNLDMSLDMTGALKVLVNTGGRKVSAKAKQVSKDAYLGFLLLRHLRIRDLRTKVRGLSIHVLQCIIHYAAFY